MSTNEKTNAKPVIVRKVPKYIKGLEDAVKILVGAGVPLDHKNRTQTWIWDRTYGKKARAAGAYLDAYKVDSNEQYKTIWYTQAEYNEKFKKETA
jgi:hypothetical protein